jgi:hypothetical protein
VVVLLDFAGSNGCLHLWELICRICGCLSAYKSAVVIDRSKVSLHLHHTSRNPKFGSSYVQLSFDGHDLVDV